MCLIKLDDYTHKDYDFVNSRRGRPRVQCVERHRLAS